MLKLLGQRVDAKKDSGVMETEFDFFDWLLTVTKLRTVNRMIPAETISTTPEYLGTSCLRRSPMLQRRSSLGNIDNHEIKVRPALHRESLLFIFHAVDN